LVVDKLYELFRDPNWKVRWVAAELILKMSETPQLPEFFAKLGQADNMAITEPLKYGMLIANMKGTPPAADVAAKYAATGTRCRPGCPRSAITTTLVWLPTCPR
jgi:hypothetical protein